MKNISSFNNNVILCCFSLLLIVSCGGSNSSDTSNNPPPIDNQTELLCKNAWSENNEAQEMQKDNIAIVKSVANPNGGIYLLMEALPDRNESPGERVLQRIDCQWDVAMEYAVTDDEDIVDFEILDDGELVLLVSSSTEYAFHKIDFEGELINKSVVEDVEPLGGFGDISVADTTLYFVARHNNLSVTLSSFKYTASTGFVEKWRTMIEPETNLASWGMHGGSYDAFEQIVQPYQVFTTVDQQGYVYVTVPGLFALFYHHNVYFDEQLLPIGTESDSWEDAPEYWPQMDAIVTKVSNTGERIYTSVIGTDLPDEIYGSKIIDEQLYVYGRTTRFHGQFYDGFIAKMDIEQGTLNYAYNIDIFNGDIFYDISKLTDGRMLVVGATAWSQNPVGFSVSENSEKLAAFIDDNGTVTSTIVLPQGPRHNQIRSVSVLNEEWLLFGGFDNGPGTHSGDVDGSLIRADAFLITQKIDEP